MQLESFETFSVDLNCWKSLFMKLRRNLFQETVGCCFVIDFRPLILEGTGLIEDETLLKKGGGDHSKKEEKEKSHDFPIDEEMSSQLTFKDLDESLHSDRW